MNPNTTEPMCLRYQSIVACVCCLLYPILFILADWVFKAPAANLYFPKKIFVTTWTKIQASDRDHRVLVAANTPVEQ